MDRQPDQPYAEAQMIALGRSIAIMFQSMTDNGMERADALEVIKEWVRTATLKPADPQP